MNTQPKLSNADTIRKIAEQALQDALQIVYLIELMRAQNSMGINARISKAGGAGATVAVRNAMIGYVTLLVARAYAHPRPDDLHCRAAAELLQSDKTARETFRLAMEENCLHSLNHIGKSALRTPASNRLNIFGISTRHTLENRKICLSPNIEFGIATAQALDLLALTTRVAVKSATGNNEALFSAQAFWKPWSQGDGAR